MPYQGIRTLPADTCSDGSHRLHRGLRQRHVLMISLTGVVGTGLFLGTGSSLANGGPAALLLGYVLMGFTVYAVMVSLGEIVTYLPLPGGHITLAHRFVDPAFGFAVGWACCYGWILTPAAELSAAAVLVGYWNPPVSDAVWVTVGLVAITAINLLGSGAYGEAEFLIGSVKILSIIGLIILGVIIDLGGGPSHDRLGFRYWLDPGPFKQYLDISGATGRFLAVWSALIPAAFAFQGTEIVAIAAGETSNPRRSIPAAIKTCYFRIIVAYFCSVIIIGLICSSNAPGLVKVSPHAEVVSPEGSPFVIAIRKAGIKTLSSIINGILIVSATSAASSALYTSSRILHALALMELAPPVFAKTTRKRLPFNALLVSISLSCLAYVGISATSNRVFQWFYTMTSLAGLLTWMSICITFLRFYAGIKAQGIDRRTLPYRGWGQPYLAWYGVFSTAIVVITNGFAVFLRKPFVWVDFITSYLPIPFFAIMYFGAKWWLGSKVVRAKEMDFLTHVHDFEDTDEDQEEPEKWYEASWWRLA